MKLLMHLVPLAGLALSMLFSSQPILCVLLGLILLPITVVIDRLSRRKVIPATINPYAEKPIDPPGPTFFWVAGLALIGVAIWIVTTFLPLPEALARRPLVAGGLHFSLGAIVSVSFLFFHLAWSARRGATQ